MCEVKDYTASWVEHCYDGVWGHGHRPQYPGRPGCCAATPSTPAPTSAHRSGGLLAGELWTDGQARPHATRLGTLCLVDEHGVQHQRGQGQAEGDRMGNKGNLDVVQRRPL